MTPMRKRYTANFKAQVVCEVLKENYTQGQIAAQYEVHPNLLRQWKETALSGLPRLFERDQDLHQQEVAYEAKLQELYAEIGRLTTQVAWLKKKSGLDPATN